MAKHQIARLFHGHVEGYRIEAALQNLVTLGAVTPQSQPTGGRPSTHWSTIKQSEPEQTENPLMEDQEPVESL